MAAWLLRILTVCFVAAMRSVEMISGALVRHHRDILPALFVSHTPPTQPQLAVLLTG